MANGITLYMSEGHWFLSLYNDFGDSQEVEFFAAMSLEMTEGCPMGCNGHGECVLGRCKCETGYGGDDCSQGKNMNLIIPIHLYNITKSRTYQFFIGRLIPITY